MADSEASWAPWVLGLRSGRGREWRAEGRGLCCAAKGGGKALQGEVRGVGGARH